MMKPRDGPEEWTSDVWKQVTVMNVLGHLVADDCSPRPCFQKAKAAAWAGCWANASHAMGDKLSAATRLRLIDRAARPQFEFRFTRWPPSMQLERDIDAFHRKLIIVARESHCDQASIWVFSFVVVEKQQGSLPRSVASGAIVIVPESKNGRSISTYQKFRRRGPLS